MGNEKEAKKKTKSVSAINLLKCLPIGDIVPESKEPITSLRVLSPLCTSLSRPERVHGGQRKRCCHSSS